jgi:hypothetical protein
MNQSKTDQQILTKAIEKAIAGGWKWAREDDPAPTPKAVLNQFRLPVEANDGDGFRHRVAWETLVYSPPFAQALWPAGTEEKRWIPEQEITRYVDGTTYTKRGHYRTVFTNGRNWRYHLQQMVIADDPIKYLGDNV